MKSLTASAILSIAALSSYSLAAVTIGISKSNAIRSSKRQLHARGTVVESLGNNFTGQSYMAQVTIGTPPQSISLAIDTGSSDTWVLDVKADLCSSAQYQQEEHTGCETPFNSAHSSTFKVVSKNGFHITYGDGSGADGDYFTDNLAIGGATIKSLQMGIGEAANLTQGLLGIGYTFNEASNAEDPYSTTNDESTYPNIIDVMVTQGLIDINAYSLYLDDLEASTGSIIFGGLDSDKYHGSLVQMPVVPHAFLNGSSYYSDFGVAVTSFAIGGKAISVEGEPPVAILDSGTYLTYLPETVVDAIASAVKAYDDSQSEEGTGYLLVDCSLAGDSTTFDFGFGGTDGSDSIKVSVPYSEMILSPDKVGLDLNGYEPEGISFQDICILGTLPQSEAPYILGDTFLRSAYVVYDLKNNVIALAQTNFNSTTSSIVDFKADQTAIPAVSGVASSAGVTNTATGKVGGKTTAGATATGKQTGTATGTSSTSTSTSSKSAGVATVPAFDLTALFVVGGSAVLAIFGGGWLLV